MLKRLQRLRIPLAAKCQLLFGLAVTLIIGAALFVPWQRMEQLTEQLDHTSAGALADSAVQLHVWTQRAALQEPGGETSIPFPFPPPTTGGPAATADALPVPRLISMATPRDAPHLTRFDRQALRHFQREPHSP